VSVNISELAAGIAQSSANNMTPIFIAKRKTNVIENVTLVNNNFSIIQLSKNSNIIDYNSIITNITYWKLTSASAYITNDGSTISDISVSVGINNTFNNKSLFAVWDDSNNLIFISSLFNVVYSSDTFISATLNIPLNFTGNYNCGFINKTSRNIPVGSIDLISNQITLDWTIDVDIFYSAINDLFPVALNQSTISYDVILKDYNVTKYDTINTNEANIVLKQAVTGSCIIISYPDDSYFNQLLETLSGIPTGYYVVPIDVSSSLYPTLNENIKMLDSENQFLSTLLSIKNNWITNILTNGSYLMPATEILISVGDSPWGIAITPDGLYVYVTNFSDSTVSIISTITNTVIDTISVGNNPWGITITPDGLYVYVTNFSDSTVSIISTITNTVIDTIGANTYPTGIAITPNGLYIYVTNSTASSSIVSIISTATNTVINTISVGNNPRGIAITPDGLYVYVTNYWNDTVSIISTATNTVVNTVSVGTRPNSIVFTPNGLYVYVANEYSNTISIISTVTNTVVDIINVNSTPTGITITPDGLYVYIANSNSSIVSIISTATNTVINTINVSSYPWKIAITPNGLYIYVTNISSRTVSIISTVTNTVI